MKKTLFMLAAASLAMTACTNTEEVEQGFAQASKQIGFVSHVNKNTRALGNDNFTQFSVFGSYTKGTSTTPVQIFNKTVVTKGENGWNYTDEARYWIQDATYTFYAYSKENVTTNATRFEGATLTLDSYTVDGTEANQKDLVFAEAKNITGKESGNEKVPFDFKHILSKIAFNFTSNFPEDYTVKVDQVQIRNMRDKGTFNASTGKWGSQIRSTGDDIENPDEMLTINITTPDNALAKGENVETEFIYVLPFEYKSPNVRLYFRLTIENALNEKVVSQKVNFGAFKPIWEKGKAYRYNVRLTGEEAGLEKIEFTTDKDMKLDEWETGTTEGIEFDFGSQVQTPTPEV